MKKFIVEQEFWEVFPDVKIGIIVSKDIENMYNNDESEYKKLLVDAQITAEQHLQAAVFSDNPSIKVWRQAFQQFKTKKGARSSIEALLKRVQNGQGVGTINPLVDIYNSISLSYGFPCGGEDIDTFIGNVCLTKANGKEAFIPLGSEIDAPPYEGEIVYKDDGGAICRCWNWRESVRTMLTPNTTNAFLCLELVDITREAEFQKALHELAHLVETKLGGTHTVIVLDREHSTIKL
ncbi:MAG: B3/B4 domain-containing protein [Culicoidibacterales bacterium]